MRLQIPMVSPSNPTVLSSQFYHSKRPQSPQNLFQHLLSLQSRPAPLQGAHLPHSLLYIFAYIVLQPNSAFKGLLFHLLINFYLPRQREDNTEDGVCDVCCSLTILPANLLQSQGAYSSHPASCKQLAELKGPGTQELGVLLPAAPSLKVYS